MSLPVPLSSALTCGVIWKDYEQHMVLICLFTCKQAGLVLSTHGQGHEEQEQQLKEHARV